MKTKKVKSAGRFRAGYGSYVRGKITDLESKQRKKQPCPFCKKTVKRLSSGIWQCKNCNKKFASHAYYLNK
ncbi:MAG: 50S ribosomal protein L37ae [Nanoarchaeota archaeon]|nr:50S ribosomal protein L37ae [Nanoarchaeota archaeon]MBU4087032.1 50S ribosomal protein L37ae [Nanoarchaeota archaeon]